MIDHDKFLRHLVRIAADAALRDAAVLPTESWVGGVIAEARETYQPPAVSPQAAEHEVDVRYHRGCMR